MASLLSPFLSHRISKIAIVPKVMKLSTKFHSVKLLSSVYVCQRKIFVKEAAASRAVMEVTAPEILRRARKKGGVLWHLPGLSCKLVNSYVVFYDYDKSIVTISSNAYTDRALRAVCRIN